MRGLEDRHAHGNAGAELVRLEVELAEVIGREVRVVAVDARPGRAKLVAKAEGGAEGILVHVSAVGDAEHEHRLAVERADAVLDRVDGEPGHGLVDVASHRGQPQVRLAVEEEVGVDRDAVATDADARLVDVAVRLRVGRADDLGDIQPSARGKASELVGVGDVHVAVRRLGQLDHLRGLGIGHGPDLGPLVEHGPIELDRATRALRARAADDLRIAPEVERGRGRRGRAPG